MIYLLRKVYVAIAALLVTSIGDVYGNYNAFSCYGEENQPCFYNQSSCCGEGFISADLLYWRAFESGLDICVPNAICDTITADGTVISKFSGKARDPHFKWNPGFRIGAGYELNNWDIIASWAHFHSHSHRSINQVTQVNWNLDFDSLDILVGYESLNSCFTFKPFIGLRGARIDQRLHINEDPFLTSSSIIDDLSTTNTFNKQRFSGIGPIIGLEGDFNILCGFSFYAGASISCLYGTFDVLLSDCSQSINMIDSFRIKKNLDASLAVGDASLGIRWKNCFCNNMKLILQLGLEHHRYFDYNRIGNYGDLSFDGVNFSVGLEF